MAVKRAFASIGSGQALMTRRLGAYGLFLCGLRSFLNSRLSYAQARAAVARRLEQREQQFLGLAHGNASSPYRPLLAHAGCEYQDMVSAVGRGGLEGCLRRLLDAGVRISFDEFKGRLPLRRGGLEMLLTPAAFDNGRSRATCVVESGGTSGPATRTLFDLDFLAERACYTALQFNGSSVRTVTR
jgi:hypothetical protein